MLKSFKHLWGKTMINKQKIQIAMTIILCILWIICIVAAYKGYLMYDYTKEHPNTIYKQERTITGKYSELPQEAKVKLKMYNELQSIILIGVLLLGIFLTLDYFKNPEQHWFTWVKEKVKNMEEEGNEKGN